MKLLEELEKYLLYFLVAVFPVFTLTLFSNPYIIPKEVLLVGIIGISLVLWFIKAFFAGNTKFAVGKFDLAAFAIIVAFLISSVLKTPNKMEAFLLPGVSTVVIAGAVFYFLLNQLGLKEKAGIAYSLLISAVLLSLSVLFTEVGLFAKIPQLPALFKDAAFNPMGGILPAIMYIGAVVPLSISALVKEKEAVKKIFVGICLSVMVLGLAILVKDALPGSPQLPKFPGYATSWAISVDALKESPVWGVGPANYLTAFNRFRPVSYNLTDLWAVRFTTGSNFYLTAVTELGFAGIIAFALLLVAVYKTAAKGVKSATEAASLIVLLVFMAVFPTTPLLLVLLFVLMSLLSKSEEKVVSLGISSKVGVVLSSLPVLIGLGVVVFFGSKILSSEVKFQKSLNALTANNAKTTYDFMQEAINTNPQVDRYHASIAQVEMALASSLAGKESLTDADKATVTQLVQQAINEGKNTVVLNPSRAGNWEILAQIYRSIMPFATGADQFTIQTYSQAIALDPINPDLRISLGGVYYALGKYDDAIASFKLAILAKNDLANAHYNLAIAYKAKKDYDNAITEMNNVLALVDKDSNDYTIAKTELDNLQKNRPAESSENLSAPKPVEESNIKPPITLPEEATPPAGIQQ